MQSIGSIIVNLRKVEGCIGIDFQKDDKDNNRFLLQLDLENYGLIKTLLNNRNYNIFQGALEVLCEMPIVEINYGIKPIKIDTYKNRKISIRDQIMSELKSNPNMKDKI